MLTNTAKTLCTADELLNFTMMSINHVAVLALLWVIGHPQWLITLPSSHCLNDVPPNMYV